METVSNPVVHVLLFECPQCGCPVPSAITSEKRNLEELDARHVGLECRNCHWSGRSLGLNARHHLVVDWGTQRPASRALSIA